MTSLDRNPFKSENTQTMIRRYCGKLGWRVRKAKEEKQATEKHQRKFIRKNKIAPYTSPVVTDISQETQKYGPEKLKMMFEIATNPEATEQCTKHVDVVSSEGECPIDEDIGIPEGREAQEIENELIMDYQVITVEEANDVLASSNSPSPESLSDLHEHEDGPANMETLVEQMDVDEDTPGYSSSILQNEQSTKQIPEISEESHVDEGKEELLKVLTSETAGQDDLLANTVHQSEAGTGNNEETHVDESGKDFFKLCMPEPTGQNDLRANTNNHYEEGIEKYQELPTEYEHGDLIDRGETKSQGKKRRRENKRLRKYSVVHVEEANEVVASSNSSSQESLSDLHEITYTQHEDGPAHMETWVEQMDVSGETPGYCSSISENNESPEQFQEISEEPPTEYQHDDKIDEGEIQRQGPKVMKSRRGKKRIREDLEPHTEYQQVNAIDEEEIGRPTKITKAMPSNQKRKTRKNKRSRRRTLLRLGPKQLANNRGTYPSDYEPLANGPETCSDAERGKHTGENMPDISPTRTNGEIPRVIEQKDDPLKSVMWAMTFYGVLTYTFLNYSFAVKCISIMSFPATGMCIYYVMHAISAADIPEHPISNPSTEPKTSPIDKCEVTPPQQRDPYLAKKIHRWVYREIYNYIPVLSDTFILYKNFLSIYLNPRELSECNNVIAGLEKLEKKGIISVGNYAALQEMKHHGQHQYIINILNEPEHFYFEASKVVVFQFSAM